MWKFKRKRILPYWILKRISKEINNALLKSLNGLEISATTFNYWTNLSKMYIYPVILKAYEFLHLVT